MPEISIMVPVYKVEKYLPQCIESILAQTFADFELILVDDGSPDNCGAICDEFARRDSRIKVIHQQNGGLANARNIALIQATGKYFMFVDSDDFIDCDMCAYLLDLLHKYKADIATCGSYIDYVGVSQSASADTQKISVFTAKKMLRRLYAGKASSNVWDKIYKREVFENYCFPEGHKYEDIFSAHRILGNAKRVVQSNAAKYHYRQRKSAITKDFGVRDLCDYVDASWDGVVYAHNQYPEFFRLAYTKYLHHVLLMLSKIAKDGTDAPLYQKRWLGQVKSNLGLILFARTLSLQYKVSACVMMISFPLFAFIYRLYHKRFIKPEARGLVLYN